MILQKISNFFIPTDLLRYAYSGLSNRLGSIKRSVKGLKRNYNYSDSSPWRRFGGKFGKEDEYDQYVNLSMKQLRDNARDGEKNNDTIRKFFSLLPNNVIGAYGFKIECKFIDEEGKLLRDYNRRIEEGWNRWCEAGVCDAAGKLSFNEICRLAIVAVARDGEFFARKVYGTNFNDFGFALSLIDSALCDEELNIDKKKKKIVMGVEVDEWGKPLAYYFQAKMKAGASQHAGIDKKYMRIEADDCIHFFKYDRVSQTRGISWVRSDNIRILKKYFSAELQASLLASSKMGFFKRKSEGYADSIGGKTGDGEGDKIDRGLFPVDAVPGSFEVLPEGWELQEWSPNSPQSNFAPMTRSQLQLISGGFGVSYASLSNDLTGSSFSNERTAKLEERTTFNCHQTMTVSQLVLLIYRAWLRPAILSGEVDVPIRLIKSFRLPAFQGKVHEWMDPLKDMKAGAVAIENKVKSRTKIARENGTTYEDIVNDKVSEWNLEQEAIKKQGLPDNFFDGAGNEENEDEKDDGYEEGFIDGQKASGSEYGDGQVAI